MLLWIKSVFSFSVSDQLILIFQEKQLIPSSCCWCTSHTLVAETGITTTNTENSY